MQELNMMEIDAISGGISAEAGCTSTTTKTTNADGSTTETTTTTCNIKVAS